jgi:hypothetical protein
MRANGTLAARIRDDVKKWSDVIASAGLRGQQ